MNEVRIARLLSFIYDACETLEQMKDEVEEDSEEYDYIVELYDDLFDKTTEIEVYFGILED